MLSARQALEMLQEGNRRHVAECPRPPEGSTRARREALVAGQNPLAVVLGCSDSRVPVELVFDQGFGDLFVVRVAGNVATPAQIGSVEFAVSNFGTPLVVVLGHSRCGAILATLGEIRQESPDLSDPLRAIVDGIRPSIESLVRTSTREDDSGELVAAAVRSNVLASVHRLRAESAVLDGLIQKEDLLLVGAEYSLETGVVEFFEAPPGSPL